MFERKSMEIIPHRKSRQKAYTSKFVGVNFDRQYQKFKASISVDGRKRILGYYSSELEAAKVYNFEAAKHGRPLNVLPTAA